MKKNLSHMVDIYPDFLKELNPDKDYAHEILELQKLVVQGFKQKHSLPDYPVKLNAEGMAFLRDLCARLIDELAESYDEYVAMLFQLSLNNNRSFIPLLYAFNEEVADVFHFMVEILLYSNSNPDALKTQYEQFLISQNMSAIFVENNLIETSFRVAVQQNIMENYGPYMRMPSLDIFKSSGNKDIDGLRGGRRLNEAHLVCYEKLLWKCSKAASSVRACLVNSKWTGTNKEFAAGDFHQALFNLWLSLFRYFAFADFTSKSLSVIYYRKNLINQERAKLL